VRTIGHEKLNLKFGRAGSFWLLATLLALLSAASSTPSPLYAVYAARWHFSSITLTAIFGVYALALLAALLTTGRLSDHLGRRPVVLLALFVLALASMPFLPDVTERRPGWLASMRPHIGVPRAARSCSPPLCPH
jgi:MFS family permease